MRVYQLIAKLQRMPQEVEAYIGGYGDSGASQPLLYTDKGGLRVNIADTMAQIQREDAECAARLADIYRKFLAGALCCECDEPLGMGQELIQDNERTIHRRCKTP